MKPDLLWKASDIHVFSAIFVISMMLMNVDNFHVETLANGFHSRDSLEIIIFITP